MQLCWEVGGVELPDGKRAQEVAAALQRSRSWGGREKGDVNEIREQEGPCQGNGACEEKEGQKERNGQRMAENNQGLKATLEADV